MNRAILIGNLTRDPDMKYIGEKNTPNCTFTLAINRPRRNGQDQGTDFINVVVWGKLADNCANFLRKGRQCAVEGRIQTRSYDDKEGRKVYVTEITAENVQFLGHKDGKQDDGGVKGSDDPFGDPFATGKPINISDDDLPF